MRHLKKALASLVFGGGFGITIFLLTGFTPLTWQYWVLLVVGCCTTLTSCFGNDK